MSAVDDGLEAARRGWRLEGQAPVLAALAVHVLPDPVAAALAGSVLRRTEQRVAARVSLPGVGPVLLKVERNVGLEEALLALIRPSRARAEWLAALALRERGVPVPEPLALAERRARPGRRTTVFVARFLEGARTLHAALPGLGGSDATRLLQAAGALVRRMHAAGFDHRDLHPGNLLVGPGGAADLYVIDLHRGRRASPSVAARHAALARLIAGLPAHLALPPKAAAQALLAGWLGAPGPEAAAALCSALTPRVRAYARAAHAKADGWALVASPWYARLRGDLVGVRALELTEQRLREALAEHDAALAAKDARVLKDRPKSAVTRHGGLVVKETRLSGWRGLLKCWLVPGRLTAGHVNAHRLRVRGIPTALTRGVARRGARRFTLYQDLAHLPRLDDLVRAWPADAPRAQRLWLGDALADWAADLHARGVYHGDWKALHILVERRPEGGPCFHLIDTDRLKFLRRRVGFGRRMRNLAQLHASIPRTVTSGERLRWWRRYAQGLGAGDDERAAMRRLARLLARKRRVVHAPLE